MMNQRILLNKIVMIMEMNLLTKMKMAKIKKIKKNKKKIKKFILVLMKTIIITNNNFYVQKEIVQL